MFLHSLNFLSISWTVVHFVCPYFVGSSSPVFEADIFLLVAVAVPFLGEALVAVFAHKWPQTAVHTDVIHHVAELGESVSACNAHQKLIRAACVLILGEKLHVASFDLVAVALFIGIFFHPSLLWLPLVVFVFIVLEAIQSFLDGVISAIHIHVLVSLDE